MSDFSDFLTMKMIQLRRDVKNIDSSSKLAFGEMLNANKNLNVRAPVDLISRIEVLANYFQISKAQLVTEMLESSVDEAIGLIEKSGWLDSFIEAHYKNMEENYDVTIVRGENGEPTRFKFPEKEK